VLPGNAADCTTLRDMPLQIEALLSDHLYFGRPIAEA